MGLAGGAEDLRDPVDILRAEGPGSSSRSGERATKRATFPGEKISLLNSTIARQLRQLRRFAPHRAACPAKVGGDAVEQLRVAPPGAVNRLPVADVEERPARREGLADQPLGVHPLQAARVLELVDERMPEGGREAEVELRHADAPAEQFPGAAVQFAEDQVVFAGARSASSEANPNSHASQSKRARASASAASGIAARIRRVARGSPGRLAPFVIGNSSRTK